MSIFYRYGHPDAKETWYQERYTNKRAEIAGNAFFISEAKCDVCSEKRLVLVADSSMEEYGPITVCEVCMAAAFERAKGRRIA